MSYDPFGTETRVGLQFPTLGIEYSGTILSFKEEEQKDLTTGEVKTWDNGDPKMMVVVELQMDADTLRGKYDKNSGSWNSVDDDNGIRFLFCQGGVFTAVRAALRAAGAKMEVGGKLHIKHTAVGKPAKAGWNAPKKFEATYTAPVAEEKDPFAV